MIWDIGVKGITLQCRVGGFYGFEMERGRDFTGLALRNGIFFTWLFWE